jgi:hypothetical protein
MAWPRPDRATEENFDRLQPGMSRAEVEAILGPPGDYRSGETTTRSKVIWFRGDLLWETDDVLIIVGFDESGEMWTRDIWDVHLVKPKVSIDNLLWRAKRQWRKWFPER